MGSPWKSPHKGSGGMEISLPVWGGGGYWRYLLQERPSFYPEGERKSALPQASKDGGIWLGLGGKRNGIVFFFWGQNTLFPNF